VTVTTQEAQERLTAAVTVFHAAKEAMNEAEAVWISTRMLETVAQAAAEGVTITGFEFETEYNYDDEGGYFESATVTIYTSNDDTYENHDLEFGCSPDGLRSLLGEPDTIVPVVKIREFVEAHDG
jgi:hypothetical protein